MSSLALLVVSPEDKITFGTINDLKRVRKFLLEKEIFIFGMAYGSYHVQDLMIKMFSTGAKNFVIYYSGHASPVCGQWSIDDSDIRIHPVEVLYHWRCRMNKKEDQKLLIVCDACYSGNWVRYALDYKCKDVYIQSSCNFGFSYGSHFTSLWMHVNGERTLPRSKLRCMATQEICRNHIQY